MPDAEVKCACGKTAGQHGGNEMLSRHHYMWFHNKPMKGCVYCEVEHPQLKEDQPCSGENPSRP